jgi:hypothetical protein
VPDRPDRPVNASADGGAAPITVVVFPGLSIMQRRWLSAEVPRPRLAAAHRRSSRRSRADDVRPRGRRLPDPLTD